MQGYKQSKEFLEKILGFDVDDYTCAIYDMENPNIDIEYMKLLVDMCITDGDIEYFEDIDMPKYELHLLFKQYEILEEIFNYLAKAYDVNIYAVPKENIIGFCGVEELSFIRPNLFRFYFYIKKPTILIK